MWCVDPWRAVREMERPRTEELQAILEREGTTPSGVQPRGGVRHGWPAL